MTTTITAQIDVQDSFPRSLATITRIGKVIKKYRNLLDAKDGVTGKWSQEGVCKRIGHATGHVLSTLEGKPRFTTQQIRIFDEYAIYEICGLPFNIASKLDPRNMTDEEFDDFYKNLRLDTFNKTNTISLESVQHMDLKEISQLKSCVDKKYKDLSEKVNKRREMERQILELQKKIKQLG